MNASIPEQLIEACRGLAAYGLGPNVGGRVSIGAPGERQYYTHAFDRAFEEFKLEDVVLLDFEGRPFRRARGVAGGAVK